MLPVDRSIKTERYVNKWDRIFSFYIQTLEIPRWTSELIKCKSSFVSCKSRAYIRHSSSVGTGRRRIFVFACVWYSSIGVGKSALSDDSIT